VSLFFRLIWILFFLLFSPSFSRLRALVDDGWFMLRVPRLYCCDSFSLRLMVMDDQWHNPHTYWRIFFFFFTLSGHSNCFGNNIAFSSLKAKQPKTHSVVVNHKCQTAIEKLVPLQIENCIVCF
jgi:hypothetical protein